jgi:rhomboid family GlyGly-CTERM serine protease
VKALRVPLLLFALPAVLVAFAPARHGFLVLDRAAVGEVWRLWSGHWVHFSVSHLAWDLAVLLAAGTWLERLRPGLLLRHTLLAAPLISWALLVFESGLQAYGGLSGLATGVVVLLALHQLRTSGSARPIWMIVLALVVLKATGDATPNGMTFVRYEQAGVRASSLAHAAGAVIAALHYLSELLLARPTRAGP